MKEIFGIAALIVSVGANIPYVIEIVQGKAKPERISWLLWTLLGGVYFFSTIIDTGATLFTAGELIGPVIILLLSLKFGVGGKSRFDLVSLAVALVALGLLLITESVLASLILALFVDGIGITLTIRKLRIDPSSESRGFWAMGAISSILAVLSLTTYSVNALLFPIYVLAVSTYILIIAKPPSSTHSKEIDKLWVYS